MTMRRQALRSCEPVPKFASCLLTLPVVAALAALANQSSHVDLPGAAVVAPKGPMELALLLLAILSAVTLAWWRYHRRDFASPRRIGRRT